MNEYIPILFDMATTVHLPGELLEAVDERAKALGMNRNRYIIRALRKALDEETTWSNGFLSMLEAAAGDEQSHRDVDDMVEAISAGRTKKRPPKL